TLTHSPERSMIPVRNMVSAVVFGALAQATLAADTPAKKETDAKVSYYKEVRPIFQQHCQGCHQPAKAQGGYVMTSYADLFKKTDNDAPGIVSGSLKDSEVYQQIISHKGAKPAMPRGKEPLSDREVTIIKKWIEQGAKDDTPASAKLLIVDADHPPVYTQSPVINALAFSKDGELLAVTGYHEILLHKGDGSGLVARLIGVSE